MSRQQQISDYYKIHHDELLAFVSSRLGNSFEAEDIVQDVFLHLLTSGRMISEQTLPALVYTVMRHLMADHFRRCTVFERYEHYIKKVGSKETSMESVFSAREITEQLERGLARLPENCRRVYRLHIYGGMKVSEISHELGEGYKSVEHRLGTARKAMRQFLRQYA